MIPICLQYCADDIKNANISIPLFSLHATGEHESIPYLSIVLWHIIDLTLFFLILGQYGKKLKLSMLGKKFHVPHFEIFFLSFTENRFQISYKFVSIGDNLHEMSKLIFWESNHQLFFVLFFIN